MPQELADDFTEILETKRLITDKEYIEIISHAIARLRTPLTGVMGYLAMMSQKDFGELSPEQMKVVDGLLEESQRLIRYENGMLELNKLRKSYSQPKNIVFENKPKVLLFEDERMLRSMYEMKFRLEGFDVAGYDSPTKDPVSVILKEKPAIILSGVTMPDLNGFDAAEIYKADDRTKNIPLVFLTNLGMKEDVQKGLALGAVAYLVKANHMPIEIINKIREILKMPIPAEKPIPKPGDAWHGQSVQDMTARAPKQGWWQRIFR